MKTAPDRHMEATRSDARMKAIVQDAYGTDETVRWILEAAPIGVFALVLPLATRLGIATGAFFGAAAMTSALMGRLAERIGPGRAMRSAALASAVLQAALDMSQRTESREYELEITGPPI